MKLVVDSGSAEGQKTTIATGLTTFEEAHDALWEWCIETGHILEDAEDDGGYLDALVVRGGIAKVASTFPET